MSLLTLICIIAWSIVAVICVFALWVRTKHAQGFLGELSLKICDKIWLPETGYDIVSDLLIEDKKGTTQIDHVILSRFGIFVIEAKCIEGKLYASADRKYRKWKIYKGKKYYTFQNPYLQNYRHRCALAALLNLPVESLHDVIFMSHAELKVATPELLPPSFVCGQRQFANYILSFDTPVYSEEEVARFSALIKMKRLENTRENKQKHIASLKSRWEKKDA
jgi:hypothetical protein